VELVSGPWNPDQVRHYLTEHVIPIRVATSGSSGPIVQSLWYLFAADALWCCTQHDSVLVRRLRKDPRIGFEVSADAPPYRGVRGRGVASLDQAGAQEMLPRLIDRYQAPTRLATWLMGRISSEVVLQISDLRLASWDFTARMTR
jgi:nitroimidazol reductase NimA-like FMN-containing flavoprotein (pyridoxamine 5'-phosphate oxidase superfamily)